MPKPKQYENAMGSVFDFIFEQSKKSPTKVKPLKVTGVDGTSSYVDAVSAVLEAPLLFVNGNTMGAFQGATSVDIAAFQVGQRASDKIKLNTSDLKDALSDPSGFVNKRFQKIEGARKMQRLAWVGEEMKGILGVVWARKNNLDFETQQALLSSSRTGTGSRSEAFSTEMAQRNKTLIEKNFGSGTVFRQKADFERKFGKGAKADDAYKKYQDAFSKYNASKDETERSGLLFDRDLYTLLEGVEIRDKAVSAKTREEKSGYIAAANMLENSKAFADMKNYIADQKKRKSFFKDEIDKLKKVPGSQTDIDRYRNKIREIDSGLSSARGFRIGERLGEVEGLYYSYKDLVFDGNLLPNIITGDFFDPNRNRIGWLQPSQMKSMYKDSEKIDIHIGKETGNRFKDLAYDKMNSLYYLSPVAWVNTLYTGEGFAYMAHKGRQKFQKTMEDIIASKISKLDGPKIIEALEDSNKKILDMINGKLTPGEEAMLINSLPDPIKKMLGDSKGRKIFENFMKRDTRLKGLTHTFGTVSRIQGKVYDFFNKVVGERVRGTVGRFLLKSKIIQKYAGELIGRWMVKGGMQLLLKGVVTAITSAIGLVGTPLASAVVGFLTWIAMDLVYALAKPLIKGVIVVIKVGLLGIFGFIAVVGIFVVSVLGQYSHVSPTQIVKCDAFVEEHPAGSDEGPSLLDPDYTGPIFSGSGSEIYDKVAAAMGLSTQLELVNCPEHFMCPSIGDAWCYSADKIYCKADKINGTSAEYASRLFAHELYHQIQGANGGGAPSIVREWGADYLSGNGGSYEFCKGGVAQTATSMKGQLISSGCTEQELIDLALNKSGAISSSCGSVVLSSLAWCD
ncbi:MAG: hypothetical protein AB9915_01225 [Candidatus Dojkabacteria bacterium]